MRRRSTSGKLQNAVAIETGDASASKTHDFSVRSYTTGLSFLLWLRQLIANDGTMMKTPGTGGGNQ